MTTLTFESGHLSYRRAAHYVWDDMYEVEPSTPTITESEVMAAVTKAIGVGNMNLYQQVIHMSRYSKFREDLPSVNGGRRETWEETVDRLMDFLDWHLFTNHPLYYGGLWGRVREVIREAILTHKVMPSMRLMMTAGEAVKRNNIAAYNCAYVPVDGLPSFVEAMNILLHGTGVGYSVEARDVDKLPKVPDEVVYNGKTLVVEDSKEGWVDALAQVLCEGFYAGKVFSHIDATKVRERGTPLKTFGGRASGPEPLIHLLSSVSTLLLQNQGKQLTPLQCHHIMCIIGDVIVVGGVRRSALICLSDLDDEALRDCKAGEEWHITTPHLRLANISAVYEQKPDVDTFVREWQALVESGSGERGLFNRQAAIEKAKESGRGECAYGTNPCSEIILKPRQFCNLTEVIIRPDDTWLEIRKKVRLATVLGTIQATLTDFRNLTPAWEINAEEERLLGVSLTGICDNPLTYRPDSEKLAQCRLVAVQSNATHAKGLGVNESKAITCIKPSGTVSQLTNTASGIHPRYAPFYVRRIRMAKDDPMTQFLIDKDVAHEACVYDPDGTVVFSFPQKAPDACLIRDDLGALDQLRLWDTYNKHWCDHKPSCTVYVRDGEWEEVGAWVYEHFDSISGVSFLPYDGGSYKQAPYEVIDEKTYRELAEYTPSSLDWKELDPYEQGDYTTGTQELACVGGACEIS